MPSKLGVAASALVLLVLGAAPLSLAWQDPKPKSKPADPPPPATPGPPDRAISPRDRPDDLPPAIAKRPKLSPPVDAGAGFLTLPEPDPNRKVRPAKELALERHKIAQRIAENLMERLVAPPRAEDVQGAAAGAATSSLLGEICVWRERAVDALLETTDDPTARCKALAGLLDGSQRLEEIMNEFARGASSGISGVDLDKLRYDRLRIEGRLAREQEAARERLGK